MYYLGIDLGGTNIAAGIVDENDQIVKKGSVPTLIPRSAEEVAEDICLLTQVLLHDVGLDSGQIRWAGVGMPGAINHFTGMIEYANNLLFENVPIQKLLQERLHCAVYIENDANAAAYGEYLAGTAQGSSAVCITLGTGVGSGIIIDKKIYHGLNCAGGEIGHTVIEAGGALCTCGRRGCFESYASATGLIRMTKETMLAHRDSRMWALAGDSLERVSGRTAFDAMRVGDIAGKAVVDQYIYYLGIGLTNVINTFQPEVLCLGGGVSKEGETLIGPLEEIIKRERYSKNAAKQTRLCVAGLGNDAGIIGAAMLGRMYE